MTTTWHPWQRLHLVRPRPMTPRINPLQTIAPALGVLTVLAGLVAIGHSGFHAEHVSDPHDALAGLHYTPLFAACSMGFGLAMFAGAELVRLGRSRIRVVGDVALGLGTALLTLASSAAIGFGAVVLADLWPGQLHRALNVDHTGGLIAVIVGVAGLFAAVTAPLTARRAPATALAPATISDPPSAPPPRRLSAPTTPDVEQEAS